MKNYKLVNTDGLKGLFYKGRLIPFDKIDDQVAEQLYGKTNVLERVEAEPTPAVAVVQLAPASELASAEATGRKRSNG